MTTAKTVKNGKKARSVSGTVPKQTANDARTIKYHPLSTPESREKWRKAIKTVLAREKPSEYKTK